MSSPIQTVSLGSCKPGFSGTIEGFTAGTDRETNNRIDQMREMGFAEGLNIEVLHQNPFGKDPIAVRVGVMTIALRRKEATLVQVQAT